MGESLKKYAVTVGGLGLLPAMPGTYASVLAALIFYLLWLWLGSTAYPVILALTAIAFLVAVYLYSWAADYFKDRDPRKFVLDEIVGQWIAILFIPLAEHPLSHIAAAFFLYRAFDVAKPYPIREIERLTGAWGVVLDDVVAALYSAGGFWILSLLLRAVVR